MALFPKAEKPEIIELFKFGLGDELKDQVSGYVGVVVARTQWLNGCKRYTLDSQTMVDGKLVDSISVDEQQLTLLTRRKIDVGQDKYAEPAVKPPGGPRPTPTRSRSTPSRVGR